METQNIVQWLKFFLTGITETAWQAIDNIEQDHCLKDIVE